MIILTNSIFRFSFASSLHQIENTILSPFSRTTISLSSSFPIEYRTWTNLHHQFKKPLSTMERVSNDTISILNNAQVENNSSHINSTNHGNHLPSIPTAKLRLKPQDNNLPNVIFVSCGSFSPVTILHLRLFEMCSDWARLNEKFNVIGGYLSPVSDSYGKKGLATAKHRVKMCELAVESSNWLMVDSWEATQKEYTVTVQVLRSIKKRFMESVKGHISNPENVGVKLLCGADLVVSFTIPGVWAPEDVVEIVEKFGVVVVERPGSDLARVVESSDLLRPIKDNIFIVQQNINNDVSSTKMREAIRLGCSIKYLTPDPVVDYIHQNHLFTS